MTDRGCAWHNHDARRDAAQLTTLIEEIKAIKYDIMTIKNMEISDEAKAKPIEELEKQIAEVKERMHNAIDEL